MNRENGMPDIDRAVDDMTAGNVTLATRDDWCDAAQRALTCAAMGAEATMVIAALLRGELDHEMTLAVHGVRTSTALHMTQAEEVNIALPKSKYLPKWVREEAEELWNTAEMAWDEVQGKTAIDAQRLLGHRLSSAIEALTLGGDPVDAEAALLHSSRECAVRSSNAEVSRLECSSDEEASPYARCACAAEKAREHRRSIDRWCVDETENADNAETEEQAYDALHKRLRESNDIHWLNAQHSELLDELIESLGCGEDATRDACMLHELEEGCAERTIAHWLATPNPMGRAHTPEARAKAHKLLRERIGQYKGESGAHFECRVQRALKQGADEAARDESRAKNRNKAR